MAYFWPFRPVGELLESCEWLTSVLPTRDTEQRQQMRQVPLRTLEYRHVASAKTLALMRATVGPGDLVSAPDWTRAVYMYAQTGAPTGAYEGPVVVWRSSSDYEITSASGGALGTVVTPGDAYVAALLEDCVQVGQLAVDRPAGPWRAVTLTLQTASQSGWTADGSRFSDYEGGSLMLDRVVVGGGTAAEGLEYPTEAVGNSVAMPAFVQSQDWMTEYFLVAWYARDAVYRSIRRWIYSRAGKFKFFWLPSWQADLGVAASNGLTLTVEQYDDRELNLLVESAAGAFSAHAIGGAVYQSDGRVVLTVTPSPPSSLSRVMYLRRVRFDADRVEFSHAPGRGVAVQIPCRRVPA